MTISSYNYKNIWNNGRGGIVINFNLVGALIIAYVESKLFGWFVCVWFCNEDLSFQSDFYDTDVSFLCFVRAEGSDSDADPDGLILGWQINRFLTHFKIFQTEAVVHKKRKLFLLVYKSA